MLKLTIRQFAIQCLLLFLSQISCWERRTLIAWHSQEQELLESGKQKPEMIEAPTQTHDYPSLTPQRLKPQDGGDDASADELDEHQMQLPGKKRRRIKTRRDPQHALRS